MGQIAQLAEVWKGKLRQQLLKSADTLGLSEGKKMSALDDFERNEPVYMDVIRYGICPAGVDAVCRAGLGSDGVSVDLELLGSPLERTELASRLLQLQPIDGGGKIPDPLPEAPGETGTQKTPGSEDSTADSTPGN